MSLNEVHDAAVPHSFRYDRKKWRFQRNANKGQDVLVAKPLPPNNLFDEELGYSMSDLFDGGGSGPPTFRTHSMVSALAILRAFTATQRPSRVAPYTSEKPPVANGVAPCSSNIGVSMNDEGRIPNMQHSFRRSFRYCFRFSLRSSLSRT